MPSPDDQTKPAAKKAPAKKAAEKRPVTVKRLDGTTATILVDKDDPIKELVEIDWAATPEPDAEPVNLAERLVRVARDVGAISKQQENAQQKYKFRGIDDLMNELHQHLVKHGVVLIPRFTPIERYERPTKSGGLSETVIIEGRFTFTDGHDEIAVVTLGQASDTADKATNKAMSAALKYALIQTFTVPTRDMEDADRVTVETAPVPSTKELIHRLDECCKKIGMPREDLTAKYRERHGGISEQAFEALDPSVLLPFILSVEAHVESQLTAQDAGGYQ